MSKLATLPVFKYYFSGGGYFPIIPLYISRQNQQLKLHALIDSGATISVFKDEVAEQLGIEIERGKEIYLCGVGGRIKGYIHEVRLEIAGKELFCPVVFSHEYFVSFNLLGREVFFKSFRIIFEEKKSYVKLE